MPVTAGTAYIELRARMDQLDRDLRTAENKVQGSVARTEKGIKGRFAKFGTGFAASVRSAGPAIAAGVTAAVGGAIKAASDLGETMDFTRVTFKDAGEEVIAWADTSLESMGIARESALDAANQFGGLFNLLGKGTQESGRLSAQMVQLAVDMSSAKNVSLDEAVLALGSGLRGESEPLRRFNVLLSESAIQAHAVKTGMIKNNEIMTDAQKVQARLGLIMEQTTDIQGNYADTSDSMANSTRRATESVKDAAAELGSALAPAVATAASGLADYIRLAKEAALADDRQADSLESSKNLMTQMAHGVQEGTVSQERYKKTLEELTLAEKDWWNAGGVIHDKGADALTDHTDALNKKLQEGVPILEDGANALGDTGEAAEEAGDKMKGAGRKTASFASQVKSALGGSLKSINASFNQTSEVIAKFGEKTGYSTERFIEDLKKRAEAARNMKTNMDKAIKKGLSPEAVAAILAEGPEVAAHAFEDLAGSSKDKVRTVNDQLAILARVSNVKLGNVKKDADKVREAFSNAAGGINAFEQRLNDLPSEKRIKVTATYTGINAAEGDPSAPGVFGTPTAMALQAMSAVPGFQTITSGYRPGDAGSFHAVPPPNNAVDIGGENLAATFSYIAANYGKQARELIYGHSIIEHGRLGYYAPSDHWDHVHFADMGAIVKGPAMIAQGNITEAHIPLSGRGSGDVEAMFERAFRKALEHGGPMQVAVEADGRTLTRTVQAHAKKNRILLGGR